MNPERLDLAQDWRRYWWLVPPLAATLAIFTILRVTDPAASESVATVNSREVHVFAVEPGAELEVRNVVGDVRVTAATSPRVTVTVVRKGAGQDRDAALQGLGSLGLEVTRADNVVRVHTRRAGPLDAAAARADIVITAPADTKINIETSRGTVTLMGMLGDIHAEVLNGDIAVHLPRDRAFRLDGSGALRSEFRLETDSRTGQYVVGVTDAERASQALSLSAVQGNVFLHRR